MRKSALFLTSMLLAAGNAYPEDEAPAPPAPEPTYFELKPSLVTNLNGGPQYIRCDIQLMTEQAERVGDIAFHTPALRNELLLLLVEQDGSQLLTAAGKAALRRQALAALRQVLKEKAGDELVKDLFFTNYYVQ